MGDKRSEEVYRVVEEGDDYRLSGYRNDTGLYTSLKGARQTRNDRVRHQEAMKAYRERAGKQAEEARPVKIQRARLVWEDVE